MILPLIRWFRWKEQLQSISFSSSSFFLCRYSFITIDVLWLGNMTIIDSIALIERGRTRRLVCQWDLCAVSMSNWQRKPKSSADLADHAWRRTDQINRAVQWSCWWCGQNRPKNLCQMRSRSSDGDKKKTGERISHQRRLTFSIKKSFNDPSSKIPFPHRELSLILEN